MATVNTTTKTEALQQLLAQAEKEATSLRAQLTDADARVEKLRNSIDEARADAARTPEGLSEHRWLQAIRELAHFTVDELAAELDVEERTARRRVDQYVADGVVCRDGRVGKHPTWAFVKPVDPGADFLRSQARRADDAARNRQRPTSAPVAGTGGHSIVNAANHPEVRKVVKQAIADGWDGRMDGAGHIVLTRDGKKVRCACTPRNGDDEANSLRRKLRRAQRRIGAAA